MTYQDVTISLSEAEYSALVNLASKYGHRTLDSLLIEMARGGFDLNLCVKCLFSVSVLSEVVKTSIEVGIDGGLIQRILIWAYTPDDALTQFNKFANTVYSKEEVAIENVTMDNFKKQAQKDNIKSQIEKENSQKSRHPYDHE